MSKKQMLNIAKKQFPELKLTYRNTEFTRLRKGLCWLDFSGPNDEPIRLHGRDGAVFVESPGRFARLG